MYFTYFLLEGNEVDRSEIYYSTRSGRGWASPQKVNGLPENGIVKHPSTGTLLGQQVLFYAYNGSGQGGFDLFYSPLHSANEAGDAVPFGGGVNEKGDDMSLCFIHL